MSLQIYLHTQYIFLCIKLKIYQSWMHHPNLLSITTKSKVDRPIDAKSFYGNRCQQVWENRFCVMQVTPIFLTCMHALDICTLCLSVSLIFVTTCNIKQSNICRHLNSIRRPMSIWKHYIKKQANYQDITKGKVLFLLKV